MRRLLLLLLSLTLAAAGLASPARGGAYTASQAGNWNSASTWGGSGIPGSGDTATIASPYTVTVPDGYTATVGATGQATGYAACTVASGGKLVIGSTSGARLWLQGDLILNGTSECLTGNGGFELRFLPSGAQRIKVSFATSNVGCKGSFNGTAANRFAVLTDAAAIAGGGLTGYIVPTGGAACGMYRMTYGDFYEVDDDATVGAVQANCSFAGASDVTWANLTFGACGKAFANFNGQAAINCTITDCNFGVTYSGAVAPGNPTGGYVVDLRSNGTPTGARSFTGNYVYGQANFATTTNWTFDNSVFQASSASNAPLNLTANAWASMNGAMIVGGTTAGSTFFVPYGTARNCYLASQASGYIHYAQPPTTMNCALTDCVIDPCLGAPNTSGEGFVTQGNTSPYTIAVTGNIVVPSTQSAATAYGAALVNYVGNEAAGDVSMSVAHNTVFLGDRQVILGPETANGSAGALALLGANIGWNYQRGGPTSGTGGTLVLDDKHVSSGTGIVADIGSPAALDYNLSYNVNLTYTASGNSWYTNQGNGYCAAYTATPGAHDLVNVNPSFADPGRNLGKWWRSLGNATGGSDQADAASALAAIAKMNTSTYSSAYTVAALLAYVRAGYRPANPALVGASYPGDPSTADAAGNAWPGSGPGIGAMGAGTGSPSGILTGGGQGGGRAGVRTGGRQLVDDGWPRRSLVPRRRRPPLPEDN